MLLVEKALDSLYSSVETSHRCFAAWATSATTATSALFWADSAWLTLRVTRNVDTCLGLNDIDKFAEYDAFATNKIRNKIPDLHSFGPVAHQWKHKEVVEG